MAFIIDDAILRVGADIAPLNRQLGEAQKVANRHFGNIAASIGRLGRNMTVAGAAITSAFGYAVKGSYDFQKGMANVATLGVQDLGQLTEGLNGVRKEYGLVDTTTKELYDTLSAGVSEGAAIGVIEQAAKGARAGVGELSSALDAGTSIMNAYNLQGADANETIANMEKIQGQLVTAIKYGKTNMDDLGGSIGRIASLASEAGISSEELLSSIASLTTTGSPASEQVSALRAAIANLIKPAGESLPLIETLGLEFGATAIKNKGLNGTLRDIIGTLKASNPAYFEQREALEGQKAALEDSGAALKDQIAALNAMENKNEGQKSSLKLLREEYRKNQEALKDVNGGMAGLKNVGQDVMDTGARLFGSMEAFNAVLALTGSKAATTDAAMADMENSQVNLNKAFRASVDNDPSFVYDQSMTSLQVLREEIGGAVIPAFTELLKAARPLIEWVAKMAKENPKVVASIAGMGLLLLAGGPLLMGMSSFAMLMLQMSQFSATAAGGKGIGALIGKSGALGKLIGFAGKGIGGLAMLGGGGVMGLALSLAAIVGAAGIGWMIGTWINKAIDEWFPSLGRGIDWVMDKIVALINKIKEWLGLSEKAVDPNTKYGKTLEEIQAERDRRIASGEIQHGAAPKPKALGGAVWAGVPYMTGEAGRELILPRMSGEVLNNATTERLVSALGGGGGGRTYNFTINAAPGMDELALVAAINRRMRLAQ